MSTIIWFVSVIIITLTGCASLREVAVLPTPIPHSAETPYSRALGCLGQLYQTYYRDRKELLVVVVDEIADDTGHHGPSRIGRPGPEFPERLTRTVKVAVSKIHPDIRVAGSNRRDGQIMIEGRVTGWDPGESLTKIGFRWFIYKLAEAFEGSINADVIRARSTAVLDLQVIDLPMELSAPSAYSSLMIPMWRGERSVSGAVGAYSAGVGGTYSETTIQPGHWLTRSAAELGVLQLMGRKLLLPWPRCLDNEPEDKVLNERVMSMFGAPTVPDDTRVRMIQRVLTEYGVQVEATGRFDAATKKGVERVASALRLRINAGLADTYVSLYLNIPFDRSSLRSTGLRRGEPPAIQRGIVPQSSLSGAATSRDLP